MALRFSVLAGRERWLEHAARAGSWKDSRIIPVGRNAAVHWLKLPVRPQHSKIQQKTSEILTSSSAVHWFTPPEGRETQQHGNAGIGREKEFAQNEFVGF